MRWVIAVAVVGCGAAQPTPAPPPTPQPQPTPTPTPTADTPLHLEPLPTPPPDAEKPRPPPPTIADACRGTALDLASLERSGACSSAIPPVSLPATAALSIDPAPVAMRGGTTASARVVLTNTADVETVFVLDDACHALPEVTSQLQDGSGNRVDVDGEVCGTGRGCAGASVMIALAPHGTAFVPFTVDGRKQHDDHDCAESRVGRVAPGRYELVAYSNLGEVHGKVVVR
jgi:hypothetical protein